MDRQPPIKILKFGRKDYLRMAEEAGLTNYQELSDEDLKQAVKAKHREILLERGIPKEFLD